MQYVFTITEQLINIRNIETGERRMIARCSGTQGEERWNPYIVNALELVCMRLNGMSPEHSSNPRDPKGNYGLWVKNDVST